MPRWPALIRRARRPGPLFWDTALAVVLAALSLLTVETGGGVSSGVVERVPGTEVQVTDVRIEEGNNPGDPWTVEITVLQEGSAQTPLSNVEPLLTIQNTTTGEWATYEAKPTGEPGVYRVRGVFPDEGVYSYSVLYGDFEETVTIGAPGGAPLSPPAAETHASASGSDPFPVWPAALALVATLPIALRRRFPIPVLGVTLSAAAAMYFIFDNFLLPGAVIALYTIAAHVGRPSSIRIGLATAFVLAFPVGKIIADTDAGNAEDSVAGAAVYGVFAAAWLLGDNLRTRRAYLREVEERAARLEREREANARRAAAEEQARIARELHDIIAHNVSVMTVQAAAAGDAFETQPGRVREALASIESTGREALTELRRLLGSVRPDDGSSTFAPQPRLAGVDALVEQVRAAGLAVELAVEGTPQELPPGVDLSAYRIVQEALTNTLKHADATKASVRVRYGAEALEVEVVDNGRGASADGAGEGRGVIGMKERAALLGGDLRVGPGAGGGFAVRARIPLGEAES
jgi:signal transduction histidine kinase